jgi:hypothetical protein
LRSCRARRSRRPQLQGASADDAQLQGASLVGAQLQGASLQFARLQGASLEGARVNATDFAGANLWRTNWGETDRENPGVVRLNFKDFNATWKPVGVQGIPWDAKTYALLRDLMNSIPEGKWRDWALKRIEILDCGKSDKKLASCDPAAKPPREVYVSQGSR